MLSLSWQSCWEYMAVFFGNTISTLHANLHVMNFQRCERASGSWRETEPELSTSSMSEIAACPLSPVADNPFSSTISHLLPVLQSVTLPACSLDASPCMPTVVLYCCTLQGTALWDLKCLFFVFVFYVLCEKYYRAIIMQYYIADCVSWVPRLTFLDLETCSWKGTHSYVGDLL